jgi:hypothetical protein
MKECSKRIRKVWFLALIYLLMLTAESNSFPPIACEFYGTVALNLTNAPAGTIITAYDQSGIFCGRFTVVNSGYYGLLSCDGDDPDTTEDEGASSAENITFYINSLPTRRFYNFTWYQGSVRFVAIDVNYRPVL